MFRKMTAVIAALAVPIMMAACGGEGDPGQAEPPGARAVPAAEARAETNARPGGREEVPAPTRPQRLNLSPTEEPSATGEAAKTAPGGNPGGRQRENPQIGRAPSTTETASPERAPTDAEHAAATRAASAEAATPRRRVQKTLSGDTSPEGLIPEDPETNDEVLLQDIYALMDLDQFALNPNQAIPLPDKENMSCCGAFTKAWYSEQRREDHPPTLFDYEEVRDHPYLHLFPGLKGHVDTFQNMEAEGRGLPFDREFQYHPNRDPERLSHNTSWKKPGKRFLSMGGITHFIYHPWFEPVEYRELYNGATRSATRLHQLDEYQRIKEDNQQKFAAMPHWFGKNSTRGVIADAVARALEQARRPGVKEHPVPTLNIRHNYLNLGKVAYGGSKNLAGHLRTPIETIYGDQSQDGGYPAYRLPFVQWEFLHPSLPIIRVTSFVAATLPLANPGEEPRATGLAVSFVISFQNRWTSFEDPNRWLIRFEDEVKNIWSEQRINQEFHERLFPRYWHTNDYMQHRLIGPVIVQVYEHEKQEPGAIEPGVYAVEPKVSHWEAPGPILKDEQVLVAPIRWRNENNKTGIKIVRTAPQGSYPNPGWPLPGHVMTNPATGPGTKIWKDAGLDWYDW